jgi:hypothetical protein
MRDVKAGDRVTVQVEATVIRVSNAHGECYQLQLDKRDFHEEARQVFVDPDEVIAVTAKASK